MSFNELKINWSMVNEELEVVGEPLTSESDLNGRKLVVTVENLQEIEQYDLHLYWESTVKQINSLDVFSRRSTNVFELELPHALNSQGKNVRVILQLNHKNKVKQINSIPFIIKLVVNSYDKLHCCLLIALLIPVNQKLSYNHLPLERHNFVYKHPICLYCKEVPA